ncbi:gamma-butyrobetaine hydroxylase-like domain-containing protein [Paraburkholderia sp. SIMBA_030]|uniref:gamma-butyrobetaine hydroxylase-like domain-containing protein n=1 Tax=Paraburkholderia sp. SIMBA_030 TaxID=3085773 RepID=UPI00397E73CF
MWLRDNCPSAFHPHTGERSFDLLSVSKDIHPLSVSFDDTTLTIEWSEQAHISHFEQSWLREFGLWHGSYCPTLVLAHPSHLSS